MPHNMCRTFADTSGMPVALSLDTAVSRIAQDNIVTRAELAAAARLAASRKDPSALAGKLAAVRDRMTGTAADAFDQFSAAIGTGAGDALATLARRTAATTTPPTPTTTPTTTT